MSLISYKKLFHLLLDKDMESKDLQAITNLTVPTMLKLKNNKTITTETILRICEGLKCQPGDIMEYIDDNGNKPGIPQIQDNSDTLDEPLKRSPGRPRNEDSFGEYKLEKSSEAASRKRSEKLLSEFFTSRPIPLDVVDIARKNLPHDSEDLEAYGQRIQGLYEEFLKELHEEEEEELLPCDIMHQRLLDDPKTPEEYKPYIRNYPPGNYETETEYIERICRLKQDEESQKDDN